MGGRPPVVKGEVTPALEAEFGKLAYKESDFANAGVRHRRLRDGAVTMDQNEYIAAFRPISVPEFI
eukprot:5891982-Lingulodinium_polyedra.AAC.1